MRTRLIFGLVGLVVLIAFAASSLLGGDDTEEAGSGEATAPGADRAVDEGWDAEAAILRSQIIERALDDGVGRSMASCMLTAVEGSIDLERMAEVDLSGSTGSGVSAADAEILADALLECGPSPASQLAAAAPGALSIPASFATPAECLRTAFTADLRAAYVARFRSRTARGPVEVDVMGPLRDCEAAPAVILGASQEGLLDVASLGTLEWGCLAERLPPAAFERAFPIPDEPGDALARLGSGIADDIAYCEAWVAGQPVTG